MVNQVQRPNHMFGGIPAFLRTPANPSGGAPNLTDVRTFIPINNGVAYNDWTSLDNTNYNNLIWTPKDDFPYPYGTPVWYMPELVAGNNGAPAVRKVRASAWEIPKDETADPNDNPSRQETTVTVYNSTPGWGGYGGVGGPVKLELLAYPEGNWPVGSAVDPLITKPTFETNPATPDDGSGNHEFLFQVQYKNRYNLPPRPWMPGLKWLDTGEDAGNYGVYLYLDIAGTGDYRVYPMYPEDPIAFAGGTYNQRFFYRILPFGITNIGEIGIPDDGLFPGQADWGYSSLACGTYHYFFAASDDYLKFWDDSYVLHSQPDTTAWGESSVRGGTPLDPTGRRLVQYAFSNENDPTREYSEISRDPNRRYSSFQEVLGTKIFNKNDYTLYVDRPVRVPGFYEDGLDQTYPWKASEHPDVSCRLTMPKTDSLGVSYASRKWGWERHLGTLSTINGFYRAVNPLLPGGASGGSGASLAETAGATTNTECVFRIMYQQKDGQPPLYVRVYINNASERTGSSVAHQYTAYTMYPDPSQPQPLNFTNGVMYIYKTKLPAGPHTYYFEASDGIQQAMWPRRLDKYPYWGGYFYDWWIPTDSIEEERGTQTYFDNDYVPGPYVNNPCVLLDNSVTPGIGKQGDRFRFRVLYRDPDGQRPHSANLWIETKNGGDPKKVNMLPEVNIDPNADNRNLFRNGIYYYFDTADATDLVLETGIRRHYYEFTDDWGRQNDPNDPIKGQTTRLPVSAGSWIQGPTITENERPSLNNPVVESSDGSNTPATVWTFKVTYSDPNNDKPGIIKLYIGELQPDGKTILWNSGFDMIKTNPSNNAYANGVEYFYQTRLGGTNLNILDGIADEPKQYFYSFVATDGVEWARYHPETSNAASTVVIDLTDDLATGGAYDVAQNLDGGVGLRFRILAPPVNGVGIDTPLVGPVITSLPEPPGILSDAQVRVNNTVVKANDQKSGWSKAGDNRYSVMRGISTRVQGLNGREWIELDDPRLVGSIEGVYTSLDDLRNDNNNYYAIDNPNVYVMSAQKDNEDQSNRTFTPQQPWWIKQITEINTKADFTGTNIPLTQINKLGKIVLADGLNPSIGVIYIKYLHNGYRLGDNLVRLSTLLPSENTPVWVKYSDIRFTHQIGGTAEQLFFDSWIKSNEHFRPNGDADARIKSNADDPTSSIIGVFLNQNSEGINYFNPFVETLVNDQSPVNLQRQLPNGTGALYARYYRGGDYIIDRSNGIIEFTNPQPNAVRATYHFGRKMPEAIRGNTSPVLERGRVTPDTGGIGQEFTFFVIYRDFDGVLGQAPEYVRVYIDNVAYDMIPSTSQTGTNVYREGVLYEYITSVLTGGSHSYRFEASDGSAIAIYDYYTRLDETNPASAPNRPTSGVTIRDLNGPWVNNPPVLLEGSATPNPESSSITNLQSVEYSVVYRDADNDPPYAYEQALDSAYRTKDGSGKYIYDSNNNGIPDVDDFDGSPRVWIDGDTLASVIRGVVSSLEPDPLDAAGNKRIIVARQFVDDPANTTIPEWANDSLVGKLLQITSGPLRGRVYLIQSNIGRKIIIATQNLETDGLTANTRFRIGGLLMQRANPADQNFAAGVRYTVTVPRLAVGDHNFRFTARSRVTRPQWLTDQLIGLGEQPMPYSLEVRFPATGVINGPKVTGQIPEGNVAPVLFNTQATSIYRGPLYQTASQTGNPLVVSLSTATGIVDVVGVYENATLNANANITNLDRENKYSRGTYTAGSSNVSLTSAITSASGDELVQLAKQDGNSIVRLIPDHAASIGTVLGVYVDDELAGTNYYTGGSFVGGKINLGRALPTQFKYIYVKYIRNAVTPPVYVAYITNHTVGTNIFTDDPMTFRVQYSDADGDPPTFHDGVRGFVRLVLTNTGAQYPMSPVNVINDYTVPSWFSTAVNNLPSGSQLYHFGGSDGYFTARWPIGSAGNISGNDYQMTINARPEITSNEFNPSAGVTGQAFEFTCKYRDDAIGTPSVIVRLIRVDTPLPTDQVYPLTAGSGTIAAGRIFSRSITISQAGRYQVRFEASDGYKSAVSIDAGQIVVTPAGSNTAPVIKSYNVIPETGRSRDNFVFKAKYFDAEGHPPVVSTSGRREEGLLLVLDGDFSRRIIMRRTSTADPVYDGGDGEEFQVTLTGSEIGPGRHTYAISASDGLANATIDGAQTKNVVVLVPYFSDLKVLRHSDGSTLSTNQAFIGEEVRIEAMINFPQNDQVTPPSSINNIAIQVAKPDGTMMTLQGLVSEINNWKGNIIATYPKGADPSLITGESMNLTFSGQWRIGLSWGGNSNWDAAQTFEAQVLSLRVNGPMRTVTVAAGADPATGETVVDMITPPYMIATGDPGMIFGFEEALRMQIIRWNPGAGAYFRYNLQGAFPALQPGEAFWIKPTKLYPGPESILPEWVRRGWLTFGNPSFAASPRYDQQYKLIKVFARDYVRNTGTNTLSPMTINVKRGWNQIGNIFFNWRRDANGNVVEDLGIPVSEIKVRYLNQTKTLAEAASAGWVRDYAWWYDPIASDYKLIHPTRAGALRTIKAWNGYWFRAFVDCQLIIDPNTSYTGQSLGIPAGNILKEMNLDGIDAPPPAPF